MQTIMSALGLLVQALSMFKELYGLIKKAKEEKWEDDINTITQGIKKADTAQKRRDMARKLATFID